VADSTQAVSPSSPPRPPGLADTGSLGEGAAPATVRAPPVEGGRDDPCFLPVSLQDQGGCGLSRPYRPHSTTKTKIQGGSPTHRERYDCCTRNGAERRPS
jgi:hypothetical protein